MTSHLFDFLIMLIAISVVVGSLCLLLWTLTCVLELIKRIGKLLNEFM